MNVSVSSDNFGSDSEKEDIPLESSSTNSDSFLEFSDVCLEGYTSSIESTSDDSCDSASATEIEDDKLVILNFYRTLSMKLSQTYSVESSEVKASVEHLMSNYRQVSDGILPTEIDFTKKSNCIGYLHRYAACHTALVFDAVSEIFESSFSDVLLHKLNKKSLNVIFLGGGPGNDFVGFLCVLHRYHYHLFELDITVVDKMSGWKDVFNETVESLRRGDCGKAGSVFDEINVMTTFISADLKYSKEWDENLLTKLQNADIVFFVKALSHVPTGDKPLVLQNVVSCMKLESLLIYIDYPCPYGAFASLKDLLKAVYLSSKSRYNLNYKTYAFGYSNIDTCRAEAIVFIRRQF